MSTGDGTGRHVTSKNVTVTGVHLTDQASMTVNGGFTIDGSSTTTSSTVNDTVELTPELLRLVQDVVDEVHAAGLWADAEMQQTLRDLAAAVGSGRIERGTARRLLERVERHAGAAGLVIGAVELAQNAFG